MTPLCLLSPNLLASVAESSSSVLIMASSLPTINPIFYNALVFPNGDTVGILAGTKYCVQLPFIFWGSYHSWPPLTHAISTTSFIVPTKNILAYFKMLLGQAVSFIQFENFCVILPYLVQISLLGFSSLLNRYLHMDGAKEFQPSV